MDQFKYKSMQLPRTVVVGHGALGNTGKVCRDLKLNGTALLVEGSATKLAAGDAVKDVLEASGYDVHDIRVASASIDEVQKVSALVGDIKADFLLGVGGGKSIDIAKVASTERDIPFISVPTAASHDGIVSSRASIDSGSETASVSAQAPLAVVADTSVIAKAPYRLLASGCCDIIAKYSAVRDWQLAHRLKNTTYSEYASALALMTAQILVDSADSIKPGLEESAWMVIKALVSSGVAMSIAGSSRPASGSEHKFSHALDRISPTHALHGEQCGVGTIMMMYLHGGDWKSIKTAIEKIGAPSTARELGVSDEHIVEALVRAHEIRPERYTILGTGLTEEAARRLARVTGVIES